MIECLLVLSILSLIALIFVPVSRISLEYHRPLTHYQLEAMGTMSRIKFNERHWFNQNGNVNKSGKFEYKGKKCLVYLGYGRYVCE